MEAETKLERIEIEVETGEVFLKFRKIVKNGETVLFSEPHRTSIANNVTIDDHMAVVNNHLIEMGFPAAAAADIQLTKDMVDSYTVSKDTELIALDK